MDWSLCSFARTQTARTLRLIIRNFTHTVLICETTGTFRLGWQVVLVRIIVNFKVIYRIH